MLFQGGNGLLDNDQEMHEDSAKDKGAEGTAEAETLSADESGQKGEDNPNLERDFNELQQRFLRLAADFENYRRRTRQESAAIRLTANERLLRDLIPIIDNFERALEAAKKDLPDNIITGIEMIYRQLGNLLVQEGVEAMESVGKPFDPNYQNAFERVETTEFAEGIVTAEVQKGYLLQGSVLRPALVIVAKNPETETNPKSNSCQEGAYTDE